MRRASRLLLYGGGSLPRAGASGSRGRASGEPRAFSRTRGLPLAPCAGASRSENRGEAAPVRDGLRIIRKSGARRVKLHRMDLRCGAAYKHKKGARAVKRALPSACVYARPAERLARALSLSLYYMYIKSTKNFPLRYTLRGCPSVLEFGSFDAVAHRVTKILNIGEIVIWE